MRLLGAVWDPNGGAGRGLTACRRPNGQYFALSHNGVIIHGTHHLTAPERTQVGLLEQEWEDHDRKLAETNGKLTREQAARIAFHLNNLHRTSRGPCKPAVCLVWARNRIWGVYSTVPIGSPLPEGALIFGIPTTFVNSDYVLDQVSAGRVLQRPHATHA